MATDKVKVEFELDAKLALKVLQILDKNFEDFANDTTKNLKKANFQFDVFIGNLAARGVARSFEFLADKFRESFELANQFETGLINVAKTSNLTEKEIAELGDEIDNLTKILPVSSRELLENAKVAGQLGVVGSKNILKFSATLAKLGRVSDLEGEAAAQAIARILNVTREGSETVDTFASVIVSLGNNFAATESEIVNVTNEIARATTVFNLSSAEAAALATTLRAIGVRSEEAGTVIGKSFRAIETAVNLGGKRLKQLEKITGESGEELKKQFGDDAIGVFQKFIGGLKRLQDENAILSVELEKVGLTGERVQKVLPALSGNVAEFERALNLANIEVENATALNVEFERSLQSTDSQLQLLNNAVEKAQRNIGEKLASAFKIVNPLLLDFVLGLSETETETFARQTTDVEVLTRNLRLLRAQLKQIQADDKISFFEADPEDVIANIKAFQDRLDEINTEKSVEELARLNEQLEGLQAEKAIAPLELQFIIPGEETIDSRIEGIKTKIANLNNFIAVQNETLRADEEEAGKKSIDIEKEKIDGIRLLKENRALEEALTTEEAEELAALRRDEDFTILETQLGREEASKVIARAVDLANTGKLAEAKDLIDKKVEKARVDLAKKQVIADNQLAQQKVNIAANAGNLINAIAGKQTKAGFLLGKVAAAGQILISDGIARASVPAVAGNAASAAGPAAPGVFASTVASLQALITANTSLALATVAATTIQGFQFGGFVSGPRTGDKNRIGVNGDEAILTPSQQRRFMDIANGVDGQQTNGGDIASSLNNIAEALRADKVTNISGREVFRSIQNELDSGSEFSDVGAA